jgi:membrane fusion protein (multidrug efflux system)
MPIWTIAFAGGLSLVAAYVFVPALYFAETDDAYVQADTVSVVPKVGAYVTALRVGDNTRFAAGQLLVELDPRDFQVAVASAAADLQVAQTAKANVEEQLQEQTHVVAAAQAAIEGDRSTLTFAQQQLARYDALASNGGASRERWQQAQSDSGQRSSALQHDLAMLDAAQAQVKVLQSRIRQADAAIARQQAALAQARLNLSYTKIFTVAAGSVVNRSVQVGNYVQPGQTLFSAVPSEVYVIANFKETQLTHMQPGQPVTLRVDAFPHLQLRGHVDSLQRGTGSNFARLPPENATGNFVKVVQRVPVKIDLDGPPEALASLSPGMSVEATVTIEPPPRWLAPLL